MAQFDIDDILTDVCYRNKKGYLNLEEENDITFLENILYEKNYSPNFIKEYVDNLMLDAKTKDGQEQHDKYIQQLKDIIANELGPTNDSPNAVDTINAQLNKLNLKEIKSILKFKSEQHNMEDFVNFINTNSNIEQALLFTGKIKGHDVGRGETSALVCIKDINRGGKIADLLLHGNLWEVKSVTGNSSFRAGGRLHKSIIKLSVFLWRLAEMFEDKKMSAQADRIFASTSQFKNGTVSQVWNDLVATRKGKDGEPEINFSEIGNAVYKNVFEFIIAMNGAIKELENDENLSDDDKREVLRIRGINRDFNAKQGTKDKLNKANVGKSLQVNIKPELSDYDDDFLDRFSVMKHTDILSTDKHGKKLATHINNKIKRDFMSDYTGGLLFVSISGSRIAKYQIFNIKEFVNNFDVFGITQSNRARFQLKKVK